MNNLDEGKIPNINKGYGYLYVTFLQKKNYVPIKELKIAA